MQTNLAKAAALLLMCSAAVAHAIATEKPRAEFLFLGSYHMNNPGRDVGNIVADDVLSPKRQQEIAAVVAAVEKFRPTKVMVEVRVDQQNALDRRLAAVCAGSLEPSREEHEQIGFRLACKMKRPAVYAVDWDEAKPPKDLDYRAAAERHGQLPEYERMLAAIRAWVEEDQAVLQRGTVLDMLLHQNSSVWRKHNAAIYQQLGLIGTRDDPVGANWMQYWYGRNLMIFNEIVRATEPGDRVLVVYGAGHANLLRALAKESGVYQLREIDGCESVCADR
jgi:hypothetical protein